MFATYRSLSMYNAKQVAALTAISAVSMSVLSFPAYAEPTGSSTHLLPLDARNVTVEVDAGRLESTAEEINTSTQQQGRNSADISDVIDSELLDQFVDENGDVDLPLGLTVFSTMGDPSIGIGGDF
ncbi:MAG: hypothetical protein F6J95_014565 [Leptolyngbya sp. SIO1E4]|nr:hypothetical protein [Leptolyngbya sp. SIO1E4]